MARVGNMSYVCPTCGARSRFRGAQVVQLPAEESKTTSTTSARETNPAGPSTWPRLQATQTSVPSPKLARGVTAWRGPDADRTSRVPTVGAQTLPKKVGKGL